MRILPALAALWLLASCSSRHYTSSTKQDEMESLNYFEPFAYISYIEKGNQAFRSDSLSVITRQKTDSVLISTKAYFRLSEKISLEDDFTRARVEQELARLSLRIASRKKGEILPLSPVIDSLLAQGDQRFTLATVVTGFGRRKGNYGGQVAKGAAIGLVTLGMYMPMPVKSSLMVHAFIFDAQKKEVAFYRHTAPAEKEPTSEAALRSELTRLLGAYFYP